MAKHQGAAHWFGVDWQKEVSRVLFSWYFKGFELLRRYLVKHSTGVDMESLDLEEVDKEMAMDEAAQSSAPEGDAPGTATDAPAGEDSAADAWVT